MHIRGRKHRPPCSSIRARSPPSTQPAMPTQTILDTSMLGSSEIRRALVAWLWLPHAPNRSEKSRWPSIWIYPNARLGRVWPARVNTPDRPENCYNDRHPMPVESRLRSQSFGHCGNGLCRCINVLRCDLCIPAITNQSVAGTVRRPVSGSKLAPCGRMDCRIVVALRSASGPNLVPRRLECVQSLGMPTTPIWPH